MSLPSVPPAFHWTDESWGAALRCTPLEAVAPHLFSTRQLGLSSAETYELMGRAIGATQIASLTQVHGREVVVIRDEPRLLTIRPEADALVSNTPGVALAVRVADCAPVLMADRSTGAVAAVHAGWRGTAARVAVAAIAALSREFGTKPADVVVAIGPTIGRCCYEVGTDVVDAFAAAGHERYLIDRWFVSLPPPRGSRALRPLHLDVAGANRDQLVLAGVAEENIHIAGLCTAMHLDVLTSFRVEKDRAGRLAGVIRTAIGGRAG